MCGIFGYTGKRKPAGILLEGLKKLEYRGYDSCGIALNTGQRLAVFKTKGPVSKLAGILRDRKIPACCCGIAHTRWATHGTPTRINAHPHLDCWKKLALVHNGIIENFAGIKKKIASEHKIKSSTDTEIIAHLIGGFLRKGLSKKRAILKTAAVLRGSFALGILFSDEPGVIWGVKKESPLMAGLGRGECFLSSDSVAMLSWTKKAVYLKDEEVARINPQGIEVFSFRGKKVFPQPVVIKQEAFSTEKGRFQHFMLKEIFEQPKVSAGILSRYAGRSEVWFGKGFLSRQAANKIRRIFIVACGTAYHAGFSSKYLFERIKGLSVEADVSSEFRYRKVDFNRNDLVIAISQSGETADTLAAVNFAKQQGCRILAVCNVENSALTRAADFVVYTLAGPEIGVASTKAFTAQMFCLYLIYLYIARARGSIVKEQETVFLAKAKKIPLLQNKILTQSLNQVRSIARQFSQYGCFLFLGRGINFPLALEGALKLKEISYIPAEGYAAGEMKHGPIALIDEYRAVVCLLSSDSLFEKMVSNMQEIKARKGKVLAITDRPSAVPKGLADKVIALPKISPEFFPLLASLPLQLFAYFVAKNLGRAIDKPRNLAKSVTVE